MLPTEFRTGVIRPIECFKAGWELIKDQYWLYFAMSLVGMIIGGAVPFGIVLGAMFCGLYYALLQKASGEPIKFEDLFKGFDVFVPSLIPTLIWLLPMTFFFVLAYIPLIIFQFSLEPRGRTTAAALDPNTAFTLFGLFGVFALLGALVGSIIHVFVIFSYPLLTEKRVASGWEAFKLSARAGWANLSGVVGLIACQIGLGFLGYLFCFVGLYFTFPLMFAGVFAAYRQVFPLTEGFSSNLPPPPPQFVKNSQWQ